MEQTQPLKKRIVEIPSTETEQKETQRTSRIRQYCQYVPVGQVIAQPVLLPIQPQILKQKQPQKQPQKKTQMQPQMKSEMKPITEAQTPSQTQQPQQPQPLAQIQTQTQGQPQTQQRNKAQTQLQSKPQAQPQRQTQEKLKTEPQPQPQPQSKQQAIPQSQTPMQPITQPSLQLQAQLQTHLKAQMQTASQTIGSVIEVPSREEPQQIDNGIRIIEHIYKEPPMMLNAWTQTSSEDLLNAAHLMGELKTAVLIARIETLQESLRESYDYINANLNVTITPAATEEEVPEAVEDVQVMEEEVIEEVEPFPESAIKNEVQSYRILSQGNEYNSDENIEIEVSVESGEVNNENNPPSTPKVYKIRKTPNPEPPKSDKKDVPQLPCGPKRSIDGENCIAVGPNQTKVPEAEFNKITWGSASIATRKLLTLIFDRETLATHSMTGKASPAFKDLDKPVKGRLDPAAVHDIIHVVSQNCGVSAKEVRSAITTKCADENKMLKLKEMKRLSGETKRPILGELRPKNSGQARRSNVI